MVEGNHDVGRNLLTSDTLSICLPLCPLCQSLLTIQLLSAKYLPGERQICLQDPSARDGGAAEEV